MCNKTLEQTLVLIKPDALKNSLTGYVLSQLSEFHAGLHFAGLKVVCVTRILAEEHYAEHHGKLFYPSLLEYIMGKIHYPDERQKRRVIAIVYQGPNAVGRAREIAGPTNPHAARQHEPGSIRSLGTVAPLKNTEGEVIGERMDNLVHASATCEEAEREIKLWFKPSDIPPLMRAFPVRQSQAHFYYKEDSLSTTHQPGSICILAPADPVWESDLNALHLIRQGLASSCSLETVVAKYLLAETNKGC
ncbi:MAG: nucleoside-diphosphate kinase [Candidatus Hydrogenedentes bacterium]|nr:nucleoside-diphosphate kinase [Candidatus Hydrogenedentota bacterium]